MRTGELENPSELGVFHRKRQALKYCVRREITQVRVSAEVGPDYVLLPRTAIENLMGLLLGSLGGNITNGEFANANILSQSPTNFDPKQFLADFEQACRIDLRLRPLTIQEHLRHVKRLLAFLRKHPLKATRQDLRQFFELDPTVNAIKAVRVLYGKFLGSDLASCFKVPQPRPRVIIVPTRKQLQQTHENLKTLEMKAAFLLLATSGLRRHELMELTPARINLDDRMILPNNNEQDNPTKGQWITFFNDEAKSALQELLLARSPGLDERIFTMHNDTTTKVLKRASTPSGFQITPQVLRDWFSNELGRLGVQDRYIDAFCGRVPRSVLARHYTDFSPERLKQIYDKAGLKVFE